VTTRHGDGAQRLARDPSGASDPGIGPVTALTFASAGIEDPHRFASVAPSARILACARASGRPARKTVNSHHEAGDTDLRRLLVGSAPSNILGPFGPYCDLRRSGWCNSQRGWTERKKRAARRVIPKLAGPAPPTLGVRHGLPPALRRPRPRELRRLLRIEDRKRQDPRVRDHELYSRLGRLRLVWLSAGSEPIRDRRGNGIAATMEPQHARAQ